MTTKNMQINDPKVVWFCLRTGCSREEALKYLKESKFKVEVAIRNRNTALRIKNRAT